MIVHVVSIRDSASEVFGRPAFVQSVGAAVRDFTDEVNRDAADNPLFKHPGDFSLWKLAVFDDNTGRFLLIDSAAHGDQRLGDNHGPVCLSRGSDVAVRGA